MTSDPGTELAERLAAARHQLAHEASPISAWDELSAVERELGIAGAAAYLRAAHRAGFLLVEIDADEIPPPRPITANIHGVDGEPIGCDEYAETLTEQAIRLPLVDRVPLLADGEAQAVAALLDELAGVYLGEKLGWLARELAVWIYDRLGI